MRVQNDKDDVWYVHWKYNFKKKPRLISKTLQIVHDLIPISTECFVRNKDKEIISTGLSRVYKIDRNRYSKAEGRQRSFDKAVKIFENTDNYKYFCSTFDSNIKIKVKLENK